MCIPLIIKSEDKTFKHSQVAEKRPCLRLFRLLNKIPQTGCLTQRMFIPYGSGGSEIQDQSTCRFSVW